MTVETDPRLRVIFTDVDGTLVEHGYPVAPSVGETIAAARTHGHKVFICTGRSENDIQPEIRSIGFDGEITNGGAFARVGEERVLDLHMPRDEAEFVIGYFVDRGFGVMVQTTGQTYANQRSIELMTMHSEIIQARREAELAEQGIDPADAEKPATTFADFAGNLPRLESLGDRPVVKVVFISDGDEDLDQMEEDLGAAYHLIPGSMQLTEGSSGEVCAAGVTKGSAIAAVMDHLGLDYADAVGIGDSWNDLEMFQVCGDAVVMANADPDLKKHANHETTSVFEDGVATAFAMLGLI